MSNRFGLNQGTNDKGQYAEVAIPGCGMQTQDNGPVLYIEIENGKPVLYIWGDINQEEPTHKISLEHALESNRGEEPVKRKKVSMADADLAKRKPTATMGL